MDRMADDMVDVIKNSARGDVEGGRWVNSGTVGGESTDDGIDCEYRFREDELKCGGRGCWREVYGALIGGGRGMVGGGLHRKRGD